MIKVIKLMVEIHTDEKLDMESIKKNISSALKERLEGRAIFEVREELQDSGPIYAPISVPVRTPLEPQIPNYPWYPPAVPTCEEYYGRS